jgi:hypothetical protein
MFRRQFQIVIMSNFVLLRMDRHDVTEILLKVALNTITLTLLRMEGNKKLYQSSSIQSAIPFFFFLNKK